MSEYRGKVFDHHYSLHGGDANLVLEPRVFSDCKFDGVSLVSDLSSPIQLRGQRLYNTTVAECSLFGVAISECLVDGLVVKNLPDIAGCALEKVTIRGQVQKLVIDRSQLQVGASQLAEKEEELLAKHYDGIEWALDISDVDSPDFSVRGVPACRIRRDFETQKVLDYDTMISTNWRGIDLSGTNFRAELLLLRGRKRGEALLIASKTGPRAKRQREVLGRLQDKGLVY